MKILAIDTSSKVCSVALTEDMKKIIELHSDDEKTHSVKLMPMIDKALKASQLNLDDIDLLACSIGPGSFTGVRIGISTVKAFSDAKNIPIIGISSLEGLAYNLDQSKLDDKLICSIIDAKNNNVYAGLFEKDKDKLKLVSEFIADDLESTIQIINNYSNVYNQIIFVGDGSAIYKDQLQEKIKISKTYFAIPEDNISNSVSIAISGYKKFQDGHYGNSNTLSPLYLRKSQAERALEENKN